MKTNIYTALRTDPFGRVATSAVSVVAQNRSYGYDANGNMTNDGQFAYAWDDSDRLTEVRKGDEVVMTCRYDGLGRRRERIVANGVDGGPSTNRYIYNGWLVTTIFDGSTNVLETYTHGPDLSGTVGGAGGIGGILSCSSGFVRRFFHFDGNGNVIIITDTNQAVAATIEFGPFGTLLAHSGNYQPRYRFSSKEWDESTSLYYYGHRFYSPVLGRWLNRDQIGESKALDLYRFCFNSTPIRIDPLGLEDVLVESIWYERRCIELTCWLVVNCGIDPWPCVIPNPIYGDLAPHLCPWWPTEEKGVRNKYASFKCPEYIDSPRPITRWSNRDIQWSEWQVCYDYEVVFKYNYREKK
ncbi:MAG: RHS repeat-associated core domain-containing protein [Verrucomicrobia bacterium]|nr:RHS repeat-associated core domain-containing protein [Verrucomicrobiota bacterium]